MRSFISVIVSSAAFGLLLSSGCSSAAVRTGSLLSAPTSGSVTPPEFSRLAWPFTYYSTSGPALSHHPASVAAHLYVGGTSEVDRYAIVNGIVQGQADARLTSAWAPTTIGPDHELYATTIANSSYYVINAYATPGLTLLRTLNVPNSVWGGTNIVGLAVDAWNYLYVAYAITYPFRITGGILVYPPFSGGNAQPVVSLTLKHPASINMAFDTAGYLYVSLAAVNAIQVYSSPRTNPTLIGTIHGRDLKIPMGLASDSSSELYVACGPFNGVPPYALAYRITGPGRLRLQRTITPAGGKLSSFGEHIALFGSYLFMNTQSGVDQLNALVGGIQTPIAQISNPRAGTLSVGP